MGRDGKGKSEETGTEGNHKRLSRAESRRRRENKILILKLVQKPRFSQRLCASARKRVCILD